MATLHMDTEVAKGAQSNMTNTHQQITSLVSTMNSTIAGLDSAWMGTSATEFKGLYDQWKSSMNQLLETLNSYSTRLNTEITEWETMAAKLQ